MTAATFPLRQFIEGRFSAWDSEGMVPGPGAPVLLSSQQLPELPSPDVEGTFSEWLEAEEYLKALTLIKLLLPADPSGQYLKPLLNRALVIEPREVPPVPVLQIVSVSKDPVPCEFLGAERLELAWSVLERDSLSWVLDADRPMTGHEWIVSRSDDAATGETALVWNSDTEVAGKLRPAGTRHVARQRAELQVSMALLGGDREHLGVQRLQSEVRDLSGGGMGVWVADPFKKFDAHSLHTHRVRVELMSTEQGSNSALADVRWVSSESDDSGKHGWKMGLKFVDPTQEFCDTVEELLRPGKGDVQFLWNLWQANAK